MIVKRGNLFDSDAPALGHGVNLAGVMGAGIAKQFAARHPDMVTAYRDACHSRALHPGGIYVWQPETGPAIINMATQVWPGRDARIGLVLDAARATAEWAGANGIARVAIPQIGCGIGGLSWADVADALASTETVKFYWEAWIL